MQLGLVYSGGMINKDIFDVFMVSYEETKENVIETRLDQWQYTSTGCGQSGSEIRAYELRVLLTHHFQSVIPRIACLCLKENDL